MAQPRPLEPVPEPAAPDEELLETLAPHPPEQFHQEIEYDEPVAQIPIGVVVPFDFGLDWEYWRYLPDGVSLYFTRTPHLNRGVGIPLARDVGRPSTVGRATKTLLSLDPAAVLYACSSGSFVNGYEGERRLRDAMLDAGARDAVTASGAMVTAFQALGIERVAVATPYTRPLTQKLLSFLDEAGFRVPSTHYLGLARNIASVSKKTICDLVRASTHPRAEAVYVSCTALRTYGIVADLEAEIDMPVFTSNQLSLWAALRAARPETLDPEHPGWVIGGGQPMARSTEMLIEAARSEIAA